MQDSLSAASLKLLFYRYKDTVYYPIVNVGILFAVGAFLLFQIVIPQVTQWFSIQREVDTIKKNIKTMQDNASFLIALDQQALDSDVQTTTNAYPFEKDYTGIINSLTQTASRTGIALPDFNLSIGDSAPGDVAAKYQLVLSFAASLSVAKEFIAELEKTLPVAAVTSIENNGDDTSVSLEFYYHGFPNIIINQKEKLTALSQQEQALLAKLKTWQLPVEIVQEDVAVAEDASESASFPAPL